MKIEFIGVGEAFDPELGNTSVLLVSETKLLIDCGYAVPYFWFRRDFPTDYLDALYITHFHADHTFGLPALITRFFEEKRQKPLTIIGQPGVQERVHEILRLAYPGILAKLSYDLQFIETIRPVTFQELELSFAETRHSLTNYAIRVKVGLQAGSAIFGMSGDGELTEATRKLFSDCQFLVHESFSYQEPLFGHGAATDIVEYANSLSALRYLAFVHIQRHQRKNHLARFLELGNGRPFSLLVPEQGEVHELTLNV